MFLAPNCESAVADCSASTQPVKNPVRMTMGSEPMPMEVGLGVDVRPVGRPGEEIGNRTKAEQGVLLHGQHAGLDEIFWRGEFHRGSGPPSMLRLR